MGSFIFFQAQTSKIGLCLSEGQALSQLTFTLFIQGIH